MRLTCFKAFFKLVPTLVSIFHQFGSFQGSHDWKFALFKTSKFWTVLLSNWPERFCLPTKVFYEWRYLIFRQKSTPFKVLVMIYVKTFPEGNLFKKFKQIHAEHVKLNMWLSDSRIFTQKTNNILRGCQNSISNRILKILSGKSVCRVENRESWHFF